MAFNGSGLFVINSSGQPVVANTLITSAAFNALTADLATGLSSCVLKDGTQTVTANIPMAGFKITGLGLGTSSTDAASVQNANVLNMCEFRLTLSSGVPVTTSDVTAAETLYCTPYKGNRIALYDGTNWNMRTSAEMSIDVPDVTNCHDVFCYDNAGTPTLEVLAWTSTTARATALTTQNGVLVKTGALTRRYLGTFYSTTAGNGQIEDSVANRYLWNYYNRVRRPMIRLETTSSWTYSTSTPQQANASTSNQLNFVIGVSEEAVTARIQAAVKSSSAGDIMTNFIALDGTYPLAGGTYAFVREYIAGYILTTSASFTGFIAIGKHHLDWFEWPDSPAGTVTWNGTVTAASGITGEILG